MRPAPFRRHHRGRWGVQEGGLVVAGSAAVSVRARACVCVGRKGGLFPTALREGWQGPTSCGDVMGSTLSSHAARSRRCTSSCCSALLHRARPAPPQSSFPLAIFPLFLIPSHRRVVRLWTQHVRPARHRHTHPEAGQGRRGHAPHPHEGKGPEQGWLRHGLAGVHCLLG